MKKFDCEEGGPCGFPGCDDLSCEDYCAKANDNPSICNPFIKVIPTKKCCECGLCSNDSENTTGKVYF